MSRATTSKRLLPDCVSSTQVDREMSDRILGVTPKQLKIVERFIGVSGGPAVRGALEGRLINVLITDFGRASDLLAQVH
jgi:DNA-binding transcriptional regulator LsrR (DeoR family)